VLDGIFATLAILACGIDGIVNGVGFTAVNRLSVSASGNGSQRCRMD
jgi:hypothetical protein